MDKLNFTKKNTKYCLYCVHGKHLEYTDEVFCSRKGFVDKFNKCHKYKYDPLKRKPISLNTATYTADDFKL